MKFILLMHYLTYCVFVCDKVRLHYMLSLQLSCQWVCAIRLVLHRPILVILQVSPISHPAAIAYKAKFTIYNIELIFLVISSSFLCLVFNILYYKLIILTMFVLYQRKAQGRQVPCNCLQAPARHQAVLESALHYAWHLEMY